MRALAKLEAARPGGGKAVFLIADICGEAEESHDAYTKRSLHAAALKQPAEKQLPNFRALPSVVRCLFGGCGASVHCGAACCTTQSQLPQNNGAGPQTTHAQINEEIPSAKRFVFFSMAKTVERFVPAAIDEFSAGASESGSHFVVEPELPVGGWANAETKKRVRENTVQYPRGGGASYRSSIKATAMAAAKLLGFKANPHALDKASNEAAQPVRAKLAKLGWIRTIDVRQPQTGELVRTITMNEVVDHASEAGVFDILRLDCAFEGSRASAASHHLGGRYIDAVTGDVALHQGYRDAQSLATIRKQRGNPSAAEVKQMADARAKTPTHVRARELDQAGRTKPKSRSGKSGTRVPGKNYTPEQKLARNLRARERYAVHGKKNRQ
jgi:hypothetical protein